MSITLDSLTLPNELIWIDEYSWHKVRVNEKISLSGVRNVFESKLPSYSGRPITLESENSWLIKEDIDTLYSWTEELDKNMIITFHDVSSYTVRFRHSDQPVFEYEQVAVTAYSDANTLYKITIKLEFK